MVDGGFETTNISRGIIAYMRKIFNTAKYTKIFFSCPF